MSDGAGGTKGNQQADEKPYLLEGRTIPTRQVGGGHYYRHEDGQGLDYLVGWLSQFAVEVADDEIGFAYFREEELQ